MLFLFLLNSSVKKAIFEVSAKANASVQIFASEHAQFVFNKEVFKSYRLCKKKAKNNKNIHNYVEYCAYILDEAAIPDDGYLTKISRKFYHYNWISETFSTKYGRVVYKMTAKDKYLKSKQCLFMLVNRFIVSLCTSFLFAVLFYFILVFLQRFFNTVLKSKLSRIIAGGLVLMVCCWYYAYQYNLGINGGNGAALIQGGLSLTGDIPVILKITVTALASLIIYKEFKINKYSIWVWSFLLIALIFNPVIPVFPLLSALGLTRFVNTLCEIFFVIYLIKEYKSFNS